MELADLWWAVNRVADLDFSDDVPLLADSWVVMVVMVMKVEQVTQ